MRAGPAPSGGEGTVEGVGEALGRSQGGFSTKLHLRAEGGGKPIAAVLTAGERHEQFALDALMDKGAVPRSGRGRPRLRPRRTAGDRGYSSPPARRRLRQRRIEPVIPTRKDQPRQPNFDTAAYRERNRVERLIGRLKQYRRIATRRDPAQPGAGWRAGLRSLREALILPRFHGSVKGGPIPGRCGGVKPGQC